MQALTRASLVAAATSALMAPLTTTGAQVLECRLLRGADGTFSGPCATSRAVFARMTLASPSSDNDGYWRGTVTPAGDASAPVEIDTGTASLVRTERAWMSLLAWQFDSNVVRLRFSPDSAAVTDDDLAILRATREYLADPARWNRADTTDMNAAPTKGFTCAPAPRQSMFCALYLASVRTTGRYEHFRPAVNAVRDAVGAHGRNDYRHPLVDFNNAPSRSLTEVQSVLDSALAVFTGDVVHGLRGVFTRS